MKDQETIDAVNKANAVMILTGERHFMHLSQRRIPRINAAQNPTSRGEARRHNPIYPQNLPRSFPASF